MSGETMPFENLTTISQEGKMPNLFEFMKMFAVALGIIIGAVVLWKFWLLVKGLVGKFENFAESLVGKIAVIIAVFAGICGTFAVGVLVVVFVFSRIMAKPESAKAQKQEASIMKLASMSGPSVPPAPKENVPRADKRPRDPVFEVRTNEPANVHFYKSTDNSSAGALIRHLDDPHHTILAIPVHDEAYAYIIPLSEGSECSYETRQAPGKRFLCEKKSVEIGGKKLVVGYATYDMK